MPDKAADLPDGRHCTRDLRAGAAQRLRGDASLATTFSLGEQRFGYHRLARVTCP